MLAPFVLSAGGLFPIVDGVPDAIDAAFRWTDGRSYFFKGDLVYQFDDSRGRVAGGWPQPIQECWRGVPSDLNGAFVWEDGRTYFFKDTEYYRFNDTSRRVDDGFPKLISQDWPKVPEYIDAVFRWHLTGDTIFFKDDLYYRFSSAFKEADYCSAIDGSWRAACPFPMAWGGIPENINAVLGWSDNRTYFFKSTEFYKFDDELRVVADGYPRRIRDVWLGHVQVPSEAKVVPWLILALGAAGVCAFFGVHWSARPALDNEPQPSSPRPLLLLSFAAACYDLVTSVVLVFTLWSTSPLWYAAMYSLALVVCLVSGLVTVGWFLRRELQVPQVAKWAGTRRWQLGLVVGVTCMNLPSFQVVAAQLPRLPITQAPLSLRATQCLRSMAVVSALSETAPKLLAQLVIANSQEVTLASVLALSAIVLDFALLCSSGAMNVILLRRAGRSPSAASWMGLTASELDVGESGRSPGGQRAVALLECSN
mmetsp:Transcript_96024/g.256575  ORF Transcript_96024/g.256575 Transcript_96024/m.256575 type:complete len:480 (+) Transcript_96024:25-1464(+)